MYTSILPIAIGGLALVSAQNPPAPTPSSAVTIEGDPSFDGPVIPGTTGKLGNAQVSENNPAGASYKATLPSVNTFTNTSIRGSVTATTAANGTGVTFSVNLSGFPSEAEGPFLYHIHALPVPADGNCTAAGPHVDPYVRGEVPPCDNTQPETCQVGDLTGKHGNITTSSFTASYTDLYVSTSPASNATLVGKSIVIHSSNTTRLTCANLLPVSGSNSSGSNSSSSSNITTTTSPSSPTTPFTGSAAVNVASFGAVAAGMMALAAFLL